ncbi:MAG TPA: glycine zipper 2TM domain-containing protein [Permianibacter sp.]|nr:glycine zipper 2TM domain-containing protein [Permianibacter sp.]
MTRNSFAPSRLLVALLASLVLATTASALPRDEHPGRGRGHDRDRDSDYGYATVLESIPITRTVRVSEPREVCEDVPVEYHRERRSGGGAALGALIGAVVGHHAGRHSDHEAAGTVIGAVVGSQIGRDVSPRQVTVERDWQTRCRTIDSSYTEERIVGYRVVYRYDGRTYETELPHDPGRSLRVQVDVRPVP